MLSPGQPFQPSLLFVGKAVSLPLSGAPKRLERLVKDKHSSLLQNFVNYEEKSFITLGSGRRDDIDPASSREQLQHAKFFSLSNGPG